MRAHKERPCVCRSAEGLLAAGRCTACAGCPVASSLPALLRWVLLCRLNLEGGLCVVDKSHYGGVPVSAQLHRPPRRHAPSYSSKVISRSSALRRCTSLYHKPTPFYTTVAGWPRSTWVRSPAFLQSCSSAARVHVTSWPNIMRHNTIVKAADMLSSGLRRQGTCPQQYQRGTLKTSSSASGR